MSLVLLSTRGKSINLFLVADSPGGLPVPRSFSGRPKNVDRFCPAEIGVESSARLSPEALAVMPDYFAACLGWFFRPGPRLPMPIRYRFAFARTRNSRWD